MMNENSQEPINQESYIIEAHIPIHGSGEANLSGNLQLTGTYSGRLKLNGILTITDNTRFTGEIDVIDLVVYGEITGSAMVLDRKRISLKELRLNAIKCYYNEVISPSIRRKFTDEDYTNTDKIYLVGGGAMYPELVELLHDLRRRR